MTVVNDVPVNLESGITASDVSCVFWRGILIKTGESSHTGKNLCCNVADEIVVLLSNGVLL